MSAFEVQARREGGWHNVSLPATWSDAMADAAAERARDGRRVRVRIMGDQNGVRVQLSIWGPGRAAPLAAGPTPTL